MFSIKTNLFLFVIGSALVDWLIEHVDGIRDRKEARKYAGDLLRDRLISHVVNKSSFTEQCYYVFGEECAEILQLRNEDGTARAPIMPQPQQYPTLPSQPPPTQKLTPNKHYTNWTPQSVRSKQLKIVLTFLRLGRIFQCFSVSPSSTRHF